MKTYLKSIYTSVRTHYVFRKKLLDYRQSLNRFFESESKTSARFANNITRLPLLDDATGNTDFEPHYTYHPAWAARILAQTRPEKHVDISSILTFSTILSAFIPVEFYDFRPANLKLNGLSSHKGDLTQLPFKNDEIRSLSCMHTIEHVGLGRYGDPIDYDGDLKAINELKRVLSPGGDLLFVTPVGKPKIEFNAHRIYSYRQIIEYFAPLTLMEFSIIPDEYKETGIVKNATEDFADKQEWGCGCFWFRKA